ncbi:MAG: helix-turn-helix domain-containing protein [Saprospiraceae bacterium]
MKWICSFANASGGTLEIGKDDSGTVVGLADAKMLMEDLPNKIRNILGIIVDVNLHSENGKDWISIEVEPYPYPVSYKGQYHFRSGSTKQELIGAALDKFLLQK